MGAMGHARSGGHKQKNKGVVTKSINRISRAEGGPSGQSGITSVSHSREGIHLYALEEAKT